MFVIELNYVKPLSGVDAHLDDHRAFLSEHYTNGTFLASGPKEPRTGGIILARSSSQSELAATLALDPFQVHQVAEYRITQFHVRAAGHGFEQLVGV